MHSEGNGRRPQKLNDLRLRPSCGRCLSKNIDCDYLTVKDGRKENRPHRKLALLEAEIQRLRTLCAEHGINPGNPAEPAPPNAAEGEDEDEVREPLVQQTSSAVDGLQRDSETGGFVFRGPTSIPARPPAVDGMLSNLEWLPSLPFTSVLDTFHPVLSPEGHTELLGLFFTHLNGFYSFIDEASFRRGMDEHPCSSSSSPSSRSDHYAYSPFLHLTMLAIAAHLTDKPELHLAGTDGGGAAQKKGWPYLQQAFSLLNSELERPKVTTVTALGLLKTCLGDYGKVSLAWLYEGVLSRLTQNLGLHVSARLLVESGILTVEQQRLREAVFFSMYWDDKLHCLYVGRSPSWRKHDRDLDLPSIPVRKAFVQLGDLFARLIDSLYSVRLRCREKSDFLTLQTDFVNWKADLPKSLGFSPSTPVALVVMLHLLYNVGLLLLNRPFLRRGALSTPEGQTSIETALYSVELARSFDEAIGIPRAPITMSQCLHVPGSVLVLLLADAMKTGASHDDQERIRTGIIAAKSLLQKLAQSWATASQALSAIEALEQELLVQPVLTTADGAAAAETEERPPDEQFPLWSTAYDPSLWWGGVLDDALPIPPFVGP
ncbi:hypothetical protein JCM8547_007180 [Rhodosporidiobolus lusitaniae]